MYLTYADDMKAAGVSPFQDPLFEEYAKQDFEKSLHQKLECVVSLERETKKTLE